MLTADPDADLEGALIEWRKSRRRKRLADIHWVDALYQAYLTGLIGIIVIAVASGAIGDNRLSETRVDDLLRHAPGWLGAVAAMAIAVGLRSGSRGGPVALERAEVRHVLLAPVDRTTAFRAPAVRQLRFLLFVSIVTGGIAGDLAAKRLPGSTAAWIATGALAGLVLVGLSVGSALVAGGLRIPRWFASLLGVALIAVAVLDGSSVITFSPTAPFGRMVLWPVHFDVAGLIPIVVAVALLLAGLSLVGNASLEAAERRSTLVGQLRFAATLQDLRTVIVLRRQLAMEMPRSKPWLTLRVRGSGRLPIFMRGLRSVLRWPASRAARLVLLAAVAGGALRGAWSGTTPLVVVAGLAVFIAGLDGVEALAQEVDHPSRRDSTPIEAGYIHLRHVPVGVLVLVITAAMAATIETIPGPGQVPTGVALATLLPMAFGGVGGALVSILAGPTKHSDAWTLLPPEAQGMRLAFRTAWPPAIAVIGCTPVLVARKAFENGHDAAQAAAGLGGVALWVFVLVCGWVRMRDRIGEWWKAQMDLAMPKKDEKPDAET